MSEQKFLISIDFHEKRVAITSVKGLESYFVEREDEKGIFGNIYKGEVESVLPGMQAAFVNLGLGTNGFLYISEVTHGIYEYEEILEGRKVIQDEFKANKGDIAINQLLKPGQEILVQIIRESISTKGPRLTTHISLPGRYLVYMPFDEHIGISKRIKEPSQRKNLKSIVENLNLPKGAGVIVRTSAKIAQKKEIVAEYKYLFKQWKKLEKKIKVSKSPCLIYEERDLVLRVMRDMLSEDINQVFIDSKVEYKRCLHFLKKFDRGMRKKINYYKNSTPLFEYFSIQKEIEKIYRRKVKLKSKGYILIESTECLVSIDVNSGGYIGKKDLEDTAYFVNMEASEEIVKQIKLRDLGGIIIIDFIDMNKSKHIRSLLQKMKELLKSEKTEVDFWYSSKAGLVEMTRRRGRRNIKSLSHQECPYCKGKGVIKSPDTVAIYVVRRIKNMIENKKPSKLTVKLHPKVAEFLLAKKIINELEYTNKINISLEKESNFHIEQVEIIK